MLVILQATKTENNPPKTPTIHINIYFYGFLFLFTDSVSRDDQYHNFLPTQNANHQLFSETIKAEVLKYSENKSQRLIKAP